MRHSKHYTVREARALLPKVKQWLNRIAGLREELSNAERKLATIAGEGCDTGGPLVNRRLVLLLNIQDCFREFSSREIQIKDLERGLIDFPSIIGGREVYLCWEQGEEDIEFWHDLDSGYPGRTKLQD